MSPGWRDIWHVGVRASKSRKLVASICGVPTEIRVRNQKLKVTEINFLCIHKKLRSKRLAPVLIKEITRRCYLNGIYQAIYTAGVILPKPVSSCRYYHRPLDWLKLYEVGFSPLPHGSTKARQIAKNHLPNETSTPGLRPMQAKDLDAVHDLLDRYLRRFDLNQAFTKAEIEHWLLHKDAIKEKVIWSYVVEDPQTHKITDFVSFYSLESTVIQSVKHKEVRAAYLYYYATETAFAEKEKGLKERLLMLMNDALILAKKVRLRSRCCVDEQSMYGRRSNAEPRPVLMSSTPSPSPITRCFSNSSSSAPVTVSSISTCTITERRPLRAESTRRIFPMRRGEEAWAL